MFGFMYMYLFLKLWFVKAIFCSTLSSVVVVGSNYTSLGLSFSHLQTTNLLLFTYIRARGPGLSYKGKGYCVIILMDLICCDLDNSNVVCVNAMG